jgi:hypothetical protein
MENGYDVIAGIVESYDFKYSMNKLFEKMSEGCEVIKSRPFSPEELVEYERSGRDLQKKLKNLKKFRELSEKVVIGPICRRVA